MFQRTLDHVKTRINREYHS